MRHRICIAKYGIEEQVHPGQSQDIAYSDFAPCASVLALPRIGCGQTGRSKKASDLSRSKTEAMSGIKHSELLSQGRNIGQVAIVIGVGVGVIEHLEVPLWRTLKHQQDIQPALLDLTLQIAQGSL